MSNIERRGVRMAINAGEFNHGGRGGGTEGTENCSEEIWW
jgi:hypothetical protein